MFRATFLRLPRDVAVNTWSLVWNLAGAARVFGGGGVSPEIALLNFDEAESARLEAGAETCGVKPYAVLAFAAVDAYRAVLGESPQCLVQQASLQTRHYEPKLERNIIGDWLVGPSSASREIDTHWRTRSGDTNDSSAISTWAKRCAARSTPRPMDSSTEGRPCLKRRPVTASPRRSGTASFLTTYGVRSVCPDAGFVSWNWAAPFKMGFNAIHANGRTCITLTSCVLDIETVRALRDHAEATLRELMAPAPL